MITWLIGENGFEVREALSKIEASFDGTTEKVDGTELSLDQLPDLLMGMSLFSTQRLVVIRDLSSNTSLFEKVPEWLPRVNDDIHLVLVDTKPDKRTSSYKALKAVADVHEFPAWTDRDTVKAEQWLIQRAKAASIALERSQAHRIVNRVGVDQWQLARALEVLALFDEITDQQIDESIPANSQENIFQLFETALDGKSQQIHQHLSALSLQEDPYAVLALLQSQVLSLAAVAYADESANPAKDFGIHPFVVSKMQRHARQWGKAKTATVVELFAKTDAEMKRSRAEPWLLIERTLLEVASLK